MTTSTWMPLLGIQIATPLLISMSNAYSQDGLLDPSEVKRRIVTVLALHSCEKVLITQSSLEKAPSISYAELKSKYPLLISKVDTINTEEILARSRKYCPIVFGKLSPGTMRRMKSITNASNSILTKLPTVFAPNPELQGCQLSPADLALLLKTGRINRQGADCKIQIEAGR